MKTIRLILSLALVIFISCSDDDNDLSFINKVEAPSEVSALFQPTQDNSGLVTITPNSSGGVSYKITFGDDTPEPATVAQGENIEHIYEEGTYSVEIEATGITGLTTTVSQELVVSFRAPENLVVTIENDAAISKQVNVTATADFAMSYEVDFGDGTDILPANIGETVSHIYAEAGFYTISVTAMGAAIATTTYTEVDFEVTAILQPIASAATPPFRQESDVISIYCQEYTDVDANLFPDWGQTGAFGSTWGEFDLEGDTMLQYTNLSYQGLDINNAIDASSMEYIHIDVWTAEVASIDIFPLPEGVQPADERFISLPLVANEWNSFDIPVSDFTDQGLPVNNIKQFKFTQTNFDDWGTGTVFVDNLYFWKEASEYVPLLFDDFEGNTNITTWFGDNIGLTIDAPNVVNESINTSLTVLKYEDTGGQFANAQFVADNKFNLTGGNSVFVLKIYVPSSSITGGQPNQVSLKLQNSDLGGDSWQTQTEVIKPIVLDEWQEVTFDFVNDAWINLNFNGVDPDPIDRTDLDKVVIQVNSENNNDFVTAYIDDFAYGSAPLADTPPFVSDDFEGNGTITDWLGDGTSIDTGFANPIDGNVEGINYSSTVLLYEDTGGQFANTQFTVPQKFDIAAKGKFTLKVYVPSASITGSQPNQISLKLQNSELGGDSWQTQTEVVKPIVLDAWQEVTFDFVNDNWVNLNFNGIDPDPIDRTDLDKVVIQLNSENNNDHVTAYIDDLNYHK